MAARKKKASAKLPKLGLETKEVIFVLRFGEPVPATSTSPAADEARAGELKAAADRLQTAATNLRVNAAMKRSMMRFGMGPESWRT